MSFKVDHEIRDPIYGFITVTTAERKLIDSAPFQRLRHIHQLALTSLIYPGATHRRFEHSLGVMHLAGRVFDVVTRNLAPAVQARLTETHESLGQWRAIVRAAALLHDVGHLPFSHAAEEELLPDGLTHESLTIRLLQDDELRSLLEAKPFAACVEDVIKLATGKDSGLELNAWETILSDIITGSSFGVDRIDYLMRDSYHSGVAYGSLDYLRLTDCVRILPFPGQGQELEEAPLHLGVTEGGIYSAEALVMARHWMFSQVYFHRVRMLYDEYLCRFMMEWLGAGGYPSDNAGHLALTDNEVYAALRSAAADKGAPGHEWAGRICRRHHHALFRTIGEEESLHQRASLSEKLAALELGLGKNNVLRIRRRKSAGVNDFPVQRANGQIAAAKSLSRALSEAPLAFADHVYVSKGLEKEAQKIWNRFQSEGRA